MHLMKNVAYIIVAGCLWGIISLFVTGLSSLGFSSMQVVAIRVACSALILVGFMLVKDASLLKIRLRDIPLFLGSGLLSIVFFNFCYFEAIEVIGGAAVPALLLYTAPLFVMLLSLVLFKEPLTKRKVVSLMLALAGLGLVTGAFSSGAALSAEAVLLGLGSGLGYALYSIFGKILLPRYDALTIAAYSFVVAAMFAVPLSGVVPAVSSIACVKGVVCAVGLSLLSTVVPFSLYTVGLKGLEAGKASILATVEPLVAAIVGVVFFHELLTPEKAGGIALILVAVVLLNLPARTRRRLQN